MSVIRDKKRIFDKVWDIGCLIYRSPMLERGCFLNGTVALDGKIFSSFSFLSSIFSLSPSPLFSLLPSLF